MVLAYRVLDASNPVAVPEVAVVAVPDASRYLSLLPLIRELPSGELWSTYDADADTLYINFKRPSVADDSELLDDDVIIRYDGETVIGLTILHASDRSVSGC